MSIPSAKRGRAAVAAAALVGGITLVAILSLIAVLNGAVNNADRVAAARQAQQVASAMAARVAKISYDQESVVIWDDAVLRTHALDFAWLDENIGVWMFEYFDHDRSIVLDAGGEIVYAAMDGGRVRPETLRAMVDGLAAQISAVRAELGRAGRPKAPSVTDQILMDGRPALVSIIAIVPSTDLVKVAPGEEALLVSVQFHDNAFVREIAGQLLLEGARIVTDGEDARPASSIPILSNEGAPIGHLAWSPHMPGSAILASIVPIGFVVLAMILGAFILVTRRLWVSVERLERSEADARFQAAHDPLSGLGNRAFILGRIEAAIARTGEGAGRPALLLLDLDRFKEINDTLGHHTGDSIIREVASRLMEVVRPGETLGRLGGDEFAVVVDQVSGTEAIEACCVRLLAGLSGTIRLTDAQVAVGASIGAALIGPGVDRVEALRRADIALYAAKRGGRNDFRIFEGYMDERVQRARRIENELRAALKSGEGLALQFQPQIEAGSGRVRGVEALLRWTSPVLGALAPEEVIPVAEERGLIHLLDEWVLREACRAAGRWQHLVVAVNLSPLAFRIPGIAARILSILRETGFDGRRLEIEITETVFASGYDIAQSELGQLRQAGILIALDDFGTGYSSLAHLHQLEVDRIKIDRSFVQQSSRRADAAAIVRAIVSLAHVLDVEVTAEGVETAEQAEFLVAVGCDHLQGYYFSPSLPAGSVTDAASAGRARKAG